MKSIVEAQKVLLRDKKKAAGQSNRKPSSSANRSGINPAWLETALLLSRSTLSSKSKAPEILSPSDSDDVEGTGGLRDHHAYAKRPVVTVHEKEIKGKVRQNELIYIVTTESEHEDPQPSQMKKAKAKTKTTARATNSKAKAPVVTKPKIKTEAASFELTEDDNTSSLPTIFQEKWKADILPTLYHALFASKKPLSDFSKGPTLVKILQNVLDVSVPGHTYKVTLDSPILKEASRRTSDKCSRFGSCALRNIDSFFTKSEDLKTVEDIQSFVEWALRPDGPALYKEPTPKDCQHEEGAPGYVFPGGLFESSFIIDVAAPLLKLMRNSKGDFGPPRGGICMAAAGVERAFSLYKTGKKDTSPIPQFSDANVGHVIAEYIETSEGISTRRWNHIIKICGAVIERRKEQGITPLRTMAKLESNRRKLFIPASSPIPQEEPM